MKSALIVIDVQNFHINSKTSELPKKIDELIKSHQFDYILLLNSLIKKILILLKNSSLKKCLIPLTLIYINLSKSI